MDNNEIIKKKPNIYQRFFRISVPVIIILVVCICSYRVLMSISNNSVVIGNGTKKKVAVIVKSTESAFFKSVKAGVEAAGSEYNLDVTFEGPLNEEDYKTQNDMIYKAIENKADAIVFSAVDYEANAEAVDAAAQSGIKIIGIDSDVDSSFISCKIGTDNYEAGRMMGEAVLEHIRTSGEEAIIGIVNFDKNSQNGQEREKGFRDAVSNENNAKISKCINVISTIEDSKAGTNELIKNSPDINVIVTFNEWTSLGVGYSVEENKKSDSVYVMAFDNNVKSVGMLEEGIVDGLIVQNPYAMGYLGIENAYYVINKRKIKSDIVDTSTLLINRDNMFDDESQRALFAFEEK